MATPAKARGEYRKTAQRREQIVDAAFSVFSQVGFSGATLAEIAKRAGMTAPGLTHHFASKTELLEAVFERRDLDAQTRLEGRSGLDLLRGLVAIAERDEADRDLTRMFAIIAAEATDVDHPMHEYFQDRYALIYDNVLSSFLQLQADGLLRGDMLPADAARTYVALSDGLQLQALYTDSGIHQSAVIRRILSGFLAVPL
ncbi:TetR/AcrR family transcriptional regulator [Microbacterium aurantiacum]|uniref:TetR/AcrR family transcriptional regulator n=1 Tax=Microbacterium aurantiacum TaxID=162393 RepID=A0ABT8FPI7_9MICO|nr:TetR/AcrR family transcriptional regulator [Microbacterium aurantiacum]MDN4463115.1 TetR/AcrR family transcriptional regulator [Microbacterium aurantiacum]